MSEREDDFLSRWSRRKVEARDDGLQKKQDEPAKPVHKPGRMRTEAPVSKLAEPAPETEDGTSAVREAGLKPEQPVAPVEEPVQEDAGKSPAPDDQDYEKFDFESLNYASDYTQFMKEGVPDAVRRRALRMLWQSNPILANIDGLNDYDEDFTDAALAVKVLSSSYKPGSGYLSDEEREASYSDEAREHAERAAHEAEAELADVEDADVEDMDDEEDVSDDIETASAGPEEAASEGKAQRKNDPA